MTHQESGTHIFTSIRTAIHEIPVAYEAFLEKWRADKAAENIIQALLRIPDVKHDGRHVVHLELTDGRHIAVELFQTKSDGRVSNRIDYWERGATHKWRRQIEYMQTSGEHPAQGLNYYHEFDGLGIEVIGARKYVSVGDYSNSPATLVGIRDGNLVRFDATFRSLIYCQTANKFNETLKAMEELPVRGPVK